MRSAQAHITRLTTSQVAAQVASQVTHHKPTSQVQSQVASQHPIASLLKASMTSLIKFCHQKTSAHALIASPHNKPRHRSHHKMHQKIASQAPPHAPITVPITNRIPRSIASLLEGPMTSLVQICHHKLSNTLPSPAAGTLPHRKPYHKSHHKVHHKVPSQASSKL